MLKVSVMGEFGVEGVNDNERKLLDICKRYNYVRKK